MLLNGVICLKQWHLTGTEQKGVEEEKKLAFAAFLPVRDHKNLDGLLAQISIDITDIFTKDLDKMMVCCQPHHWQNKYSHCPPDILHMLC